MCTSVVFDGPDADRAFLDEGDRLVQGFGLGLASGIRAVDGPSLVDFILIRALCNHVADGIEVLVDFRLDLSVGTEVRKWKRNIGETLGEYEGGFVQDISKRGLGDDPAYGL